MGGRVSKNAARLDIECRCNRDVGCWASDMGARLFEDSRDALAIVDPGGHVVSINRECRLLFGGVDELQPGAKMLENGASARTSPLSDVVRLACSERLQRDEVVLFRHQHGFEIRLDVRVAPLRCGDETIGGWLVRARLA